MEHKKPQNIKKGVLCEDVMPVTQISTWDQAFGAYSELNMQNFPLALAAQSLHVKNGIHLCRFLES